MSRLDGAAVWAGLAREQRDEIGEIVIELVGAWWCREQVDPPQDKAGDLMMRAADAADTLLIDELRVAFVAAVPLEQLTGEDGRPMLPSRLGPVCRRCGCSDGDASGGGCHWVDKDLCSACDPTAVGGVA